MAFLAALLLLLTCWPQTIDAYVHGVIKHRSTGKFLTCVREQCSFELDMTQVFTEVAGHDGQSRFKIRLTDGTSLDTCLDRQHCHHGNSNSRESDCNHCGAIHWRYNSADGQLSEDQGRNCMQDDGSIKHCRDGHAAVEFVSPNASQHCTARQVTGRWLYKYTIATATTETWKVGTSKTHSESKTTRWSESVSVTVMQGWELAGQKGSISIGASIGHQTAQTYSDEWSTDQEHDFSITFAQENVGKAAWQFQFSPITDSCGHSEVTLVKEFALTETAAREPCCVPGYSTDAPNYLTCVSHDAMVMDGAANGCKVAQGANGNASWIATLAAMPTWV